MKYWLYSDGNILGPYDPAEMLGLPAFTDESLVCAETATGDNAEDWRAASQVTDLAALIGSGRSVTAAVGAAAYRLGSGSDSGYDLPGESNNSGTGNYSDLLDTIDNILGTGRTPADTTKPQPADYDFAEKFDIRLSRIQEELEAARWEKNLLLEKMRLKELEERKQKARIDELETRLRGELKKAELSASEMEQVRHLSDLQDKTDAVKRIEEIKREELSLQKYLVPESPEEAAAAQASQPPAAGPETKKLKSIAPSENIGLKRLTGQQEEDASGLPGQPGMSSHSLRSLGQTQKPAYVYGAKEDAEPQPEPKPAPREFDSYRDRPLPGPEAAPAGAFKGFDTPAEPLPQQAGGLVYDFTVVTAKPEGSSQHFKIEVPPAPAPFPAPAPYQAPAPVPAPAPYAVPAPAPVQMQPPADATVRMRPSDATVRMQPAADATVRMTPQPVQPLEFLSSAAQASQPVQAQPAAAFSPDKTQRLGGDALAPEKAPARAAAPAAKAQAPLQARPRRGGKTFAAVILLFGFIAAGGLGYFFLGDGVSFSEFSMMNFGGGKKRQAAQLEDTAGPVAVAEPAHTAAQPPAVAEAPQPETQPAAPEQPRPADKPSNENIRKALEIVKNYKLAGGRGSVESWFANSFLSGGAGGANEEWTATPLHGDILVVQYRLIRPRQDPMIYQFEVDAAKGDIVRGINNNAIELLDASREKAATVSAAPVPAKKKATAKPKARKPAAPREIGLLPLPDDTGAAVKPEADPTGFEQPENDEKVKYLKAQESDEELF